MTDYNLETSSLPGSPGDFLLPSLEEGLSQVLAHIAERTRLEAGLVFQERGGRLCPVVSFGVGAERVAPLPAEATPDDLPPSLRVKIPYWIEFTLHTNGTRHGRLFLGNSTPIATSEQILSPGGLHMEILSTLLLNWVEALGRAERLRKIEEYSRRNELIYRTSALINSTLDLDRILQVTAEEMVKAFDVDHCGIVLFEQEKGYGQVVAEYPPQGTLGSRIPLEGYPAIDYVFSSGRPIAIADARSDPLMGTARPVAQQFGLESILILPLHVNEHIVGSIGLDVLRAPKEFAPEEISTAQAIANQVAVAMAQAQLFQEKAASEERFRYLIEQAHDIIWTLDSQGRFTFVNQVAERLTGHHIAEWLGKPYIPLIVPSDRPHVEKAFQEALRGRSVSFQARVYDSGGGVRHLVVNLAPQRLGEEIVGVVGFGSDVTERKEAEEALLQRTVQAEKRVALLRSIGEVSRRILTLQNPTEALQTAVESLVKNLGYDYANVLLQENGGLVLRASSGKTRWATIGACLPLGQGITGWAAATGQSCLANDVLENPRYVFTRDLGDTRSELALPIHSSSGISGVLDVQSTALNAFDEADLLALSSLADQLGIALDNANLYANLRDRMEELERTRARLSQAEKLSALGELIAGAAHELNNPLTVIQGYTQLLQSGTQDLTTLQDLGKILSQSQRAGRIVADLLTFARQREPEFCATDLNGLVRDTFGRFLEKLQVQNIEVEFDMTSELPPAWIDLGQIEQVLINLVQNARQALVEGGKGGQVVVSTRLVEDGDPPQRWIRFTIRDDGPGIPAEVLPRVFDPFFTTREKAGGTGLGLSICYGIIERHSGRIWAESALGRGAAITFELPAWLASENVGAALIQADSYRADAKRILIVDDEVRVAEFIERSLSQLGYQTKKVSDGAAALECLREDSYDAAICELQLPGLNRGRLYERMCQARPELTGRVVFTSWDASSDETLSFLYESGTPYLLKPFPIQLLQETLQSVLEGKR